MVSADMLRSGGGWTSANKATSFLCMPEMPHYQYHLLSSSGLLGTDRREFHDSLNMPRNSFVVLTGLAFCGPAMASRETRGRSYRVAGKSTASTFIT